MEMTITTVTLYCYCLMKRRRIQHFQRSHRLLEETEGISEALQSLAV